MLMGLFFSCSFQMWLQEFKLNPNAKSFMPSQTSVRPPSPDGSFYFHPNVSSLPQIHGMPMGIGVSTKIQL